MLHECTLFTVQVVLSGVEQSSKSWDHGQKKTFWSLWTCWIPYLTQTPVSVFRFRKVVEMDEKLFINCGVIHRCSETCALNVWPVRPMNTDICYISLWVLVCLVLEQFAKRGSLFRTTAQRNKPGDLAWLTQIMSTCLLWCGLGSGLTIFPTKSELLESK